MMVISEQYFTVWNIDHYMDLRITNYPCVHPDRKWNMFVNTAHKLQLSPLKISNFHYCFNLQFSN